MKNTLKHAAAAALLLAAGSASATATVTFVQPENYRDVPFSTVERERVLKDLSGHFTKLSQRLPAGQTLAVEVLDIDLAGEVYPNARVHDLRVMKGGADWPHMHLRYRIEQDGKVVKSGEERLSDHSYLNGINRYNSESLRYEKQMLDKWFREQLAMR